MAQCTRGWLRGRQISWHRWRAYPACFSKSAISASSCIIPAQARNNRVVSCFHTPYLFPVALRGVISVCSALLPLAQGLKSSRLSQQPTSATTSPRGHDASSFLKNPSITGPELAVRLTEQLEEPEFYFRGGTTQIPISVRKAV